MTVRPGSVRGRGAPLALACDGRDSQRVEREVLRRTPCLDGSVQPGRARVRDRAVDWGAGHVATVHLTLSLEELSIELCRKCLLVE